MTVLSGKRTTAAPGIGQAELTTRYVVERLNGVVDGSGECLLSIPAPSSVATNVYNVFESVKIFCNSGTIPTITLYEEEATPRYFVGGSDRGDLNEWEELHGLRTQKAFLLEWTGADVGSDCYARVQYREIELIAVSV